MSDALIKVITQALIAVVIAVAGLGLSVILARAVRDALSRFLHPAWAGIVGNLVRGAVLAGTVHLIVQQTSTAGLLVVVVTALTTAFALGTERTAADVISGLKLLVMRQYAVGDLVTVAGQHGRVTEVTLTYTALQSDALDKLIIPNAAAINTIIINHSHVPGFPVTVTVPVGASQCVEDVTALLMKCASAFEPQLAQPGYKPSVSVADIADGKVKYVVKVFVPEAARGGDAEGLLRLSAMRALAVDGIAVG